ncbi:MAG: phosphatidate cytidylyltransferase [Gammaproteobacteria bacterium]|nr:phosphatidate cytidylyltransferase [Gammaproteobacteria bacterium]
MLGQRIRTAVVLVALLAIVLFVLPRAAAIGILATVILLGAWEWSALAGLSGMAGRAGYLLACAAGMGWLWFVTSEAAWFELLLAVVVAGWILVFGWIVLAPARGPRWLAALTGLWALVPAWVALARLLAQDGRGAELVIFVLLLVWAADIGAYFAGRSFGRVRLAPRVSPNKTWEGVLGGLLTGLLVAFAAQAWFQLPALAFLPLCVAGVLISVVGDLAESMLKRQRGLKDSGRLLPGHGGVLDRIDSLTAAAPLLALGLSWLGLLP